MTRLLFHRALYCGNCMAGYEIFSLTKFTGVTHIVCMCIQCDALEMCGQLAIHVGMLPEVLFQYG
jgi:hypothetical protein